MNFDNTSNTNYETDQSDVTAATEYCSSCALEEVPTKGTMCDGCKVKAEREDLLAKNGVTAEQVSTAGPNEAKNLMDLISSTQLGIITSIASVHKIDAALECRKVMQCEIRELSKKAGDDFYRHLQVMIKANGHATPQPEIEETIEPDPYRYSTFPDAPAAPTEADRKREANAQAEAHTEVAAKSTASELVPEFGNVLATREPTALAYGFPPAVDALITKAKLSPEQTQDLLAKFGTLFAQIDGWRHQVQSIVIRDENDDEGISLAKDLAKAMADDRINSEKRKKIIAEPYLRPKQLIDGVFKLYIDEAAPIEKLAIQKAKTKELVAAARREQIRVERAEALAPYVDNVRAFDLLNMTDEAFEILLSGQKELSEARQAEAARENEARQRHEDEAAAERVKLRRQSERRTQLSSFGFTRDEENKRFALEDLTIYDNDIDGENDATWVARIEVLKPKAEAIRSEIKRKADEADGVLRAEAEKKRLEEDESFRLEREKEAVALAPDKVKLERLADEIAGILFFETQNEKVNDILGDVRGGLTAVTMKLRSQIKQLP